jgi:hypothetical protein
VSGFAVKDSGQRHKFESGMVRDVTEGKTDYALVLDGPMFDRWAVHLTKGAGKYSKRNWMLAEGDAELQRFRESAFRHFMQWFRGDTDEDHASAVLFNINGAEFVKARAVQDAAVFISNEQPPTHEPVAVGQQGYVMPDYAKMRA